MVWEINKILISKQPRKMPRDSVTLLIFSLIDQLLILKFECLFREADERRQMMLSQMLSTEARERLARIALVKHEKARGVEDIILRAAQMGQITEKVSEARLISLLEQINTQTTKQTKVTIQRRRSVLEDDD